MNRKKKEPNKPKTLKGLNELKKLYMGLEGNAFYFEHDQDNPYDGWQDFERFYNNLILLLTYIKFLKPDKSFEKLLRLEDRSFRIG